MKNLAAKDRLIVALDVSTYQAAMALIQELSNVSFFKIGLHLFLTGQVIQLIQAVQEERGGQVFLDIKWGGDIGSTTSDFMQACIKSRVVKFITLSEARPEAIAITSETIKAAKEARQKAGAEYPHFLMVPYLSSLDASDLKQTYGSADLNAYILERAKEILNLGCDGLIVSGDAIKWCYDKFVREERKQIDIVSPGIRPTWASQDDHKRFTTPAQAIELGADYLVVGRPIINATSDKWGAAQRIIDEIAQALASKGSSSSSDPTGASGITSQIAMAAKGCSH